MQVKDSREKAAPDAGAIRALLPMVRLLVAYLPLPLTRRLIAQGVARLQLPAGVRREVVSADGVRAEWLIPQGSPADHALCYFHGGAFVLGLTSLHLEMVAHLASTMGVRALLVDYRLAPEHPFPAPLEDCVRAYRWLLAQGIPAGQVALAGDSAGGNLTLTTLMALRDEGDQLPAAAACLSPVADLTREDLFRRIYDPLLHPRLGARVARGYVAGADTRQPRISPVFGDWRGLPPLLIHAGEDEALRYDALRVAALATTAGVDARVAIYPQMWHVWHLFPALPPARQALAEIAHFLSGHLGRQRASE